MQQTPSSSTKRSFMVMGKIAKEGFRAAATIVPAMVCARISSGVASIKLVQITV